MKKEIVKGIVARIKKKIEEGNADTGTITTHALDSFIAHDPASLYLKSTKDGTMHPIVSFTDDSRFYIADTDGTFKQVKWHHESCQCGADHEWVLPNEVSAKLDRYQALIEQSIDLQLLNVSKVKAASLSAGAYQHLVDKFVIAIDTLSCPSDGCITPNSVILVKTVFVDNNTKLPMFTGFTTNGSDIKSVTEECWRFKAYDSSVFNID